MSEERRRTIDLRRRRTRGRALQGEWLTGLSKVTRSIQPADSLLPLELTAVMKTRFAQRLRQADVRREAWSAHDERSAASRLQTIGETAGALSVVLFSSVDTYVGAVRIGADVVLTAPFRVWEFTGDDLAMVTDDLMHGLCLERNFYTESGDYISEGVLQLSTWGMFADR